MMSPKCMSSKRLKRAKDKMSSGSVRCVNKSHWIADDSAKWIEATGNGAIHISAKALDIVWGNDHRFWQWVPVPRDISRFEVAAELIQVSWLQLKGTLDLAGHSLLSGKRYEVVFVVKLKADAFGWREAAVTFRVVTPNGQTETRRATLDKCGRDQWHEIPGGEFTAHSKMAGKLEFGMSEIVSNMWKGGLALEGIVIRPIG